MGSRTQDYRAILESGAPLLDVRAPIEFGKGAFPNAHNLPLLNDDERHEIGICYKQRGQDAAIALGHRLVSGDIKAERMAAWAAFAQQHPNGYLYCFRGGLRSQTVQQWLHAEAGIDLPLITGGYKAMRGFLVAQIDRLSQHAQWSVLGGMTGTGKTEVVKALTHGVDLEGLAHHRGSSFGWRARPQPAPIDFENQLGIELMRRETAGQTHWLVEDESRCIGQCALPLALYQRMQISPVVWLEAPFEERVERILHQYVTSQCSEHVTLLGPVEGFATFAAGLQQSLHNIRKRLGLERCARLLQALQQALDTQARNGDTALHRVWIEGLLREYYDPMYAYQEQQKATLILFRGDHDAVLGFLRERLSQRV
jgi:tRNA 2-selenouridine synthase